MTLKAATLTDEKIREMAEAFLAQYHPTGKIPIPILDIAEFDLGVDLFPLPDAERLFGFTAALSNDRQTIVYDENSDKKNPTRFRFTLAHEKAT